MKKKNGFDKPSKLETEMQKTFSAVISSTASSPIKVRAILEDVRHIEKGIRTRRKVDARRLIKK